MELVNQVQILEGTVCILFWANLPQHLYSILLPDIDTMVRVFANGPGDLGSIPGWVRPKTQKMLLDGTFLNTHHYKVQI